MKNITALLIFISLVFLMSGCKTQNLFQDKELPSGNAEAIDSLLFFNPNYEYKIRKNDKISISVWGQDDLSVGSTYGIYNSNEVYGKWLMVDALGTIEVPKIGSYAVLDLTVPQLKAQLKDSLAQWLVNPIVDIKILNKEISLLGEFRDPAVVPVDKDLNYLLDMIARVGGFEYYANLKQIKVLRQEGPHTKVLHIDLSRTGDLRYKNIPLYPGDIVIAPSKSFKSFDKRVSTIIPFTSAITAAAIFMKAI